MNKGLLFLPKKLVRFIFKTMVVWSAFHSGAIKADYYGFPIFGLFNEEDFRYRCYAYPFPQIFLYGEGGLKSRSVDYRIVTNTPDTPPADMPPNISAILQVHATEVHYYEAYACTIPGQSIYNYFLHTTFIPSMQQENIVFTASVGMFNTNNINESPEGNTLPLNALVDISYSYHDLDYLSGNVARFRIPDLSSPADGWFIGIYQNKAIVVHWFFFTPQEARTEYNGRQLPSHKEWYGTPVQEILTSAFVPLKTIDNSGDK